MKIYPVAALCGSNMEWFMLFGGLIKFVVVYCFIGLCMYVFLMIQYMNFEYFKNLF